MVKSADTQDLGSCAFGRVGSSPTFRTRGIQEHFAATPRRRARGRQIRGGPARLGLEHIDLYYLHQSTFTDVPYEEAVETLAGMKADGLIRNIGLSNLSVDQLRAAMSITDIAAVTAHYTVSVRLGAAVRAVAEEHGIVFSPWHPGAIPRGDEGIPFHAVIDPIAAAHDATPQQIALAWQLHRTPNALPIPGTTSVQHLKENLAAARIQLTGEEVAAITAAAGRGHSRRRGRRARPSRPRATT